MRKIRSLKDYEYVMRDIILKSLLSYLSKIVVEKLQEELDKADISTSTLQAYTTYEISPCSTYSTIYINYDEIPQSPPSRGQFGQFVSLDGEGSYEGKHIAYHMIKWLEKGVFPRQEGIYIGNQPLGKVGMFENTNKYIKDNLKDLVNKFFKKYRK